MKTRDVVRALGDSGEVAVQMAQQSRVADREMNESDSGDKQTNLSRWKEDETNTNTNISPRRVIGETLTVRFQQTD